MVVRGRPRYIERDVPGLSGSDQQQSVNTGVRCSQVSCTGFQMKGQGAIPIDVEDDEFRLLPPLQRRDSTDRERAVGERPGSRSDRGGQRSTDSSRYRRDPHAALFSMRGPATRPRAGEDLQPRQDSAAEPPPDSLASGNSTSYPTLESIGNLYRLFGYLIVGLAFPYLGYQLLIALFSADGDLVSRLVDFSQLAFVVFAGSAAITGTLFALAEGIRLAIDIQSNTLAMCEAFQRRQQP